MVGYQKISNQNRMRMEKYAHERGKKMAGRGNHSPNVNEDIWSFDMALNELLREAGF